MIDPKKTYRTRDGREVRIYAVDGGGEYPVHGAYYYNGNRWYQCSWSETGGVHMSHTTDYDLIEVRPRIQREVWVNVYPHRMGVPHGNKAYVDVHRGKDAIACVKLTIDVEEGEGL